MGDMEGGASLWVRLPGPLGRNRERSRQRQNAGCTQSEEDALRMNRGSAGPTAGQGSGNGSWASKDTGTLLWASWKLRPAGLDRNSPASRSALTLGMG